MPDYPPYSGQSVLVYLEGGGACFDPESCINRCTVDSPQLCTQDQALLKNFTGSIWSEDEEENGGSVRDITSKAIRQTIKENEDLKRQNILLEQKLEEKERKIKALERVLVTEEKSYGMLSNLKKTSYVNSASQVGDFVHCKNVLAKVGPEMYNLNYIHDAVNIFSQTNHSCDEIFSD